MVSDLQLLQGHWRQVAFQDNGLADAPDAHGAPDAVTKISGQSFHVAVPGEAPLIDGRFQLDETVHPRCIDWIDSIGEDAGKRIPAIYELGENSFRFAAADPGMARPKDFSGGQGITIRGFTRLVETAP